MIAPRGRAGTVGFGDSAVAVFAKVDFAVALDVVVGVRGYGGFFGNTVGVVLDATTVAAAA